MELIEPSQKSTDHSPDFHEWVPNTFDNLLVELNHIISSCEGPDPAPLFRGQADYTWSLDSTFVRNCIKHLFNLPDYQKLTTKIRHSLSFHRSIASLLLLKFGTLCKPSKEAFDRERTENIDPWFELLKNLQQYPERDAFIKGTFLTDWSRSKEIALYFTIYEGRAEQRKIRPGHGALWICDAVATGKTLQVKKLGEILKLMNKPEFLDGTRSLPLIFHPPTQTLQPRAMNQIPVYISQMDFRYDIADIWANLESQRKKRIFVKLIIPEETKEALAQYLESKGVSEDNVYPD